MRTVRVWKVRASCLCVHYRRARTLLLGWHIPAVGLGLVTVAASGAFLPRLLHLPQMTSGAELATPMAVIASWGAALLALVSAQEPAPPALFATTPRTAHLSNVARVLVVLAVGTALTQATAHGSVLVPLAAGATFAGEGLALAGLAGLRLAWLLPTFHLLACITLGNVNRAHGLAVWAWPLDQYPGPSQLGASLALLAVGITYWFGSLRVVRLDS
ncbi:hypothetical protein GCM10027600_37120 [Nocardioides ginsengisegetis]